MATAVIDFETFWDSKSYTLSKMGPIEYIRDDRFAAQMMALTNLDGGNPVLFEGEDIPKALRYFLNKHSDGVLLGHNISAFDALILSERYGIQPPRVWDTMSMAYWTGVARVSGNSHAALTRTLGNGEKKPGTVTSDGKHWPEDFTESEREYFKAYCCDDARQCAWNASAMLDDMTPDALRFMEITARMAYAPAFIVDPGKLNQFLRQLDEELDTAYQQVCRLFAFKSRDAFLRAVRSAQTFAYMLRTCGCEPPVKESAARTKTLKDKLTALYNLAVSAGDMDKAGEAADKLNDFEPVMTYAFAKTDLPFLDLLDHPDPRVRLLVETRLNHNSSINRSRAETLLKFSDGRPIPIILRAFAAHTSRYTAGGLGGASDGLQFQNLSKRDPSKKLLREAIRVPEGYAVVACDSSQVEARCLAWLANETDLVEQFRHGRDPYSELAEKIFHIPANEIHDGAKHGDKKLKHYRNIAKSAVLGAGYGISAARFSDVLRRTGSLLDPDPDRHRELAFNVHATYRAANPAIVAFWRICQSVIEAMAAGYEGSFGGPSGTTFTYGPMPIVGTSHIVPSIRMPSGFILRYPNLRTSDNNYVYDKMMPGGKMATVKLYGSAASENLTQGLAFQVLMWQACRMDEAGVPLHANIHDSFASVVPEQYVDRTVEVMTKCMSLVPDWAPGLPIACEAEVGHDFTVV